MTAEPARALETPPIAGQAKMESIRGRTAEWIGYRERGSQRLLRLMAYLSLHLGRRLARAALYGIAGYFFLFSPRALRHSRRYLTLALGRPPNTLERFKHVLYFATCIHDRVYLVNEQYERFNCSVEGEPLMQAQLDAGRGAFLMGAHLGSFEVMASVGRRQPGLHVSMAMYEHNAQKINTLLAAIGHAREARHHSARADRRHAAPRGPPRQRRVRRRARRSHSGRGAGAPRDPAGIASLAPDRPDARGGDSAATGHIHGGALSRRQPLSRRLRADRGLLENSRRESAKPKCIAAIER